MKRFALLGNPLGHSLSPALHKAIYRQLEIDDATYRAIELDADKLKGFFAGFRVGGFDGVNVTIPHKSEVIGLLDEIDAKARLINAVNCIHRKRNILTGYNTDMLGFGHSFRNQGGKIDGKEFVILGSGGSALAVSAVLAEGGAKSIAIVNRTLEKAELVEKVINEINDEVDVRLCDEMELSKAKSRPYCLINTTSVGMHPNLGESPIANLASIIDESAIVFDLIYNPARTALLADAEKIGAQCINGLEMLVAQAVYSVEIWMGGNVIQHIDMNCLVKELGKSISHK